MLNVDELIAIDAAKNLLVEAFGQNEIVNTDDRVVELDHRVMHGSPPPLRARAPSASPRSVVAGCSRPCRPLPARPRTRWCRRAVEASQVCGRGGPQCE